MGMLGYSGIPQETRLMFRTLARMPEVEVTGLLAETGPGRTRHVSTKRTKTKQRGIFNGAMFLIGVSGVETNPNRGRFRKLTLPFRLHRELFEKFGVAPLNFESLDDAIWRLYFQKTLDASDREHILGQKFALTNLNLWTFQRRFQFPTFVRPQLDTTGYDFLVTSQPRAVKVAPGTRHIARFHDAIPFTDADMFDNLDVVWDAYNMISRSPDDALFCCVSEPSEEALLKIFPNLRGRTTTIPNALPEIPADAARPIPVTEIIRARASNAGWGVDEDRTGLRRNALGTLTPGKPFRYILAVSTLEPRKNFTGIVRAWERMRYQHDTDIKLVIVGHPGWRYDSTLAAMRPRILEGSLLHLEDVPLVELRALYANAECLVSPSFAEGFGYPPLEAMQCGTPAVVSDITAHRWVMDDAVLYADPYSVPDLAKKITQLVLAENREATRRELRARAARVLARYAPDAVGEQWSELFQRLKRGGAPVSNLNRPAAAQLSPTADLAAAE